MVRTDFDRPETATYECNDCLERVRSNDFPGPCPECDGEMRNIAVPRE